MPLESVKVPQNVYVEDRIIGPITLRHLVILGVGAGISYVLWAIVSANGQPAVPITVLAWSPTAIAAAFAFVKINDISMTRMLLLMLEGGNKPNTRTWSTHGGISINIVTKPKKSDDVQGAKVVHEVSRLEELTKQLEKEQRALSEEIAKHDAEHPETSAKPVNPSRISVDGTEANGVLDTIISPDSK